MDKISLTIGILLGVIIGFIIAGLLLSYGISVIGDSFRVENMNITIAVNESMIVDAINNSAKRYP